jgi:hypothetical protein
MAGINRWFIVAAMLCAVPVLLPTYPPMADLPQHVASIMVLDEVHFGHYLYAEFFDFNWFRPYWLGYSLIWAISYLTGLVWASKIVVAAAVVGFVLSLAYLRREVNAPPMVDWLFLAVPFGFAYEWGFLNFVVAAPLGPLFLVYYHRFLDDRCSWLTVLGWMFLLFFGHLLILAFFCVAASCMALKGELNLPRLIKRVLPLTISIPLGLGWMLLNIEPRNVATPVEWSIGLHRFARVFPDLFSLDYNASQIVVAMALIALPFILGVRPKWSLARLAPAVFYVLFMLFGPSLIFDNLGTYQRFQIFGLMFFTLMLEDADVVVPEFLPRIETLVVALPSIIGLALLARVTLKTWGYEQESAGFHELIAQASSGKRVLGLVDWRYSEFARTPVYMHYPVWYQVEKKGLVDFNFAQWTSLNSFYKPEYQSKITSRLAWRPHEFNWEQHDGDAYHYFFLNGTPDFAAYVFRGDSEKVRLVHEGRNWYLFERISSD